MKKKLLFSKQILAGILSIVMVIETPVYALADTASSNIVTDETVEYGSDNMQLDGDVADPKTTDEPLIEEDRLDEIADVDGNNPYIEDKPQEDELITDSSMYSLSGNEISTDAISENTISKNEIVNDAIIDDEYYMAEDDEYEQRLLNISENAAIYELAGYRSENVKVYERMDHSVTAFCYPEPVNFKNQHGLWDTIDNRLYLDHDSYTNINAPFDIRFAETANAEKMFSISENNVCVSFSYVPTVSDNDCVDHVQNEGISENLIDDKNKFSNWKRKARIVSTHDTDNNAAGTDIDMVIPDSSEEQSINVDMTQETYNSGKLIPILPEPQRIFYDDVDKDVSIKYEPIGDGVKETIVLYSSEVPDTYVFRVSLKGLDAEMEEEGDIILKNKSGEGKYIIPAPMVLDSNGNDGCSAGYYIKNKAEDELELSIHIDGEWLKQEDRVFPVEIDPTIKKYRRYNSLDGLGELVTVCSDGTKDSSTLKVGSKNEGNGNDKKTNIYRTYIKPDLPDIARGSVVTEAKLRLSAGESNKLLYLIKVTKKWNGKEISWNNQPLNKEANKYDLINIADYGKNDAVTLDITKDVKAISEGREDYFGWCLVSEDESSGKCRTIQPKKGTNTPFLEITYKDFTGSENYFSTHDQSAGSAGTGSINDYTGRLSFIHTDATSAGERMPLSISHIYDVAYGNRFGEEKWLTSGNGKSSYGEHFRLSTDIRLLIPAGETDIDAFPYVYIDSDGTKHYFKKSNVTYFVNGASKTASQGNKEYPSAKDEDGLGLFVVPVTDSVLKNTFPLKIVNKSGSMSMYFDKDGYLGKITDSNLREDGKNGQDSTSKDKKQENAITITYEDVSYDSIGISGSGIDEKHILNEIIDEIKKIQIDGKEQDEIIKHASECVNRIESFENISLNVSVNYKIAMKIKKAKDQLSKITDGDTKGNYKNDINNTIKQLEEAEKESFESSRKKPVKVTDAAGISAELSYDANGRLVSMSDPYEKGALIHYDYDASGYLTKITHPNGISAKLMYDKNGHLISAADERNNKIEYTYGDKKHSTDQVTKITEYIDGTKGQTVLVDHDDQNTAVYTYSGNNEKTGDKDDVENVYCFDDNGRTTSAYSRKKDGTVIGGALRKYTDDTDPEDAANKIKEQAFTGAQVINLLTDGSFEKDKSKNGNESWEIFNTCNICNKSKDCHTVKKDTEQKYIGARAGYVKLATKGEHTGEAGFKQTIKAPAKGFYTASVYIRTKGLDPSAKARISLSTKKASSESSENKNSEDDGSEDSGAGDDGTSDEGDEDEGSNTAESGSINYDTLPDINNGWKRIEATIKADKGEDITISLSLEGSTGEGWFDCAQIETGTLANQYSLIPNGSLEEGFKKNPNLPILPSGWAYGTELEENEEASTTDENSFPEDEDTESSSDPDNTCIRLVTQKELGNKDIIPDGKRALMIKGSPIKRRSIIINPNFGSDKASYTFSCYVKADCVPVPKKDSKRKCGIYIRGNNFSYNEDDATGKYRSFSNDTSAKALINTSVQGWQYVSIPLPVRNWKGRLIEIRFDYEIGKLYVDGCMLTKNEVQTKTYTSGGKLKTEQKGERTTTYDTDGRNRRKKEKLAGGASTSYSYDNITNDIKEEKHSFRQPDKENANSLTTKYTYDEYGNVIKNSEKADSISETIVTGSEYDESGRFKTSDIDSRGNESFSSYDLNTGLLLGMTDSIGISTEYSYNSFHHLTGVTSAGDEISYSYDNKYHDRLKSINVKAGQGNDSFETYEFTYDKYGNVKQISRTGNGKLTAYSYMQNNGKLKQTVFGNGDKESYTYNDIEQLVNEKFGSSGSVIYEYDNRGNVARLTDEHSSDTKGLFKWGKEKHVYRYDYDDHGRINTASLTKKADNKKESDEEIIYFQNIYDRAGRQSVFAYYTGGKAYRTDYGYTSDDKASAATLPSGGVYKRNYDGFDRVTKDEFTPQKKAATGETNVKGGGAVVTNKYSYLETDRGEVDGKKVSGKKTTYKYTTSLPEKYETVIGTGKNAETAVSDTLGYDRLERIDSFNKLIYNYDDLGRLIRAEDKARKRIWEYSYDSCGNITRSIYRIEGRLVEDYTYGYKKGNLTEYNKQKISGYKGGNPKKYRGYTLEWERGRQLKGVKSGLLSDKPSVGYSYTHDGIRLSKTVGNKKDQVKTEYILNGSMILQEKITSGEEEEILNYYYSPDGRLLEIGYCSGKDEEHHYSVIRNALGDVVALYTAEGILVGTYEYDPYGQPYEPEHNEDYTDADGILEKNPFRYRGYYYDNETGWYYLQSRYYDPDVKRFINADSTDLITCEYMNMMQYNLFMYCNGDPVNGADPSGHIAIESLIVDGLIIIGVCATVVITVNYARSDNGEALKGIVLSDISEIEERLFPRDQNVYIMREGDAIKGEVRYVGRTNCLDRRAYEHSINPDHKTLKMDQREVYKGLTKIEARGLEQVLMMEYYTKQSGNSLANQINGIGHKNKSAKVYFDAAYNYVKNNPIKKTISNTVWEEVYNWRDSNW